jgi:hypothetical protein
MPNVSAKNAALFAGGVLLTMFVFNTLSNRVDAVKKARAKIDAGV